jgi:isoamylase
VFRRRRLLSGVEANQLQWFTTGGTPMAQSDWSNPSTRSMAVYLDGEDDPDLDADGRPLFDDDFLVVVNGWEQPLDFVLPTVGRHPSWATILDTAAPATSPAVVTGSTLQSGETVRIKDYSVLLLRDERAGHHTD